MFRKITIATLGLLLGAGLCSSALASYAVPDEDIGTGVIQTINVVTHSVVVAGHVYALSPKATYISEGGEIYSLQPGMRIRFIADGPVKNPASRIVNVVVLPPAPQ